MLWFGLALATPNVVADEAVATAAGDAFERPAVSQRLVLVVGAAGTEEYGAAFSQWADRWEELAQARQWELVRITAEPQESDASQKISLQAAIEASPPAETPLWIVLIGHGTFSAGIAKFNLIGEDVEAQELAQWLQLVDRPSVIASCFSSSGAFVGALSGQNRILLSATQNGSEINYSRFGGFLANTISDPTADLDHDDEVSLLEAFLAAGAQTERFYEEASRLATEHAILDDNADKAGTPASFFVGARVVGKAKDGKAVDGRAASRMILTSLPSAIKFSPELELQRTEIETRLDALRGRKSQLESEAYYAELEQLMLQLAELYAVAEASP